MAEEQSPNLDIAGQISAVDTNINSIFDTRKVILGLLAEADKAGNTELAKQLANEASTMSRALERQEVLGDSLRQKEAEPRLKEIESQLAELRRGVVSPSPNYMGMGMGAYQISPIITSSPSVEEQKAKLRETAGKLYNAPPSAGGAEAERLPTSLMAQVASLPTPTSKAQLLEKTYGKGNVTPVDYGGNTEFLIKTNEGTKTTFDKGVAGLAGAATELPVIASEVGSFMGILGATKSPALATIGSSTIGAGVGTAIDEGLRYAYGLNSDFGGTIARRGTEALIGAALGGVTDVAVPAMRAARIPNPFENTFYNRIESAAKRLTAEEQKLAAKQGRLPSEINIPQGARLAGQQGIDLQSELVGKYEGSNIATSARKTQESLYRLAEDVKSGVPTNPNNFSDIVAKKQAQRDALSAEIGSITNRNQGIIASALERQTKGPMSNIDQLGKTLLGSLKEAREQAVNNVRNAREEMFALADDAGFKITPEEMLDRVYQIRRSANASGAKDQSAVNNAINSLIRKRDAPKLLQVAINKAQLFADNGQKVPQELIAKIYDFATISGPLKSVDFDDFVKRFREARPDNPASPTSRDVVGGEIASGLSKYRRDVFDSLNTNRPDGTPVNVGQLFDQYSQEVGTRQKYNENLFGDILREAGGEQSKDPRAIVKAVFQDPERVSKVVQSLRELGAANPAKAGEADKILGLLQLQYMNDIGIGAGGASKVKIDDGFLNVLFGKDAAAQKRSIEDLNRNLIRIDGLDARNLTFEDLNKMRQPFSDQERVSLAKTITKRLQLEKEEVDLVNSEIFKLAQKGKIQNIDPDSLSSAILGSGTITQTEAAMRELSKASLESRNLFKGDFKRNLFDMFPGGTETANAPFDALFDTKKFVSAYESPNKTGKSQFAKKLEIVLGKDESEKLYDIAKLYEANAISNVKTKGFEPRLSSINKTMVLGIPIGKLASSVKNRYITAMLGTGSQLDFLKSALARNALPGAVNDAYNKMAKDIFLTRTGITALAHQASSDPEFSAELTNMARDFKEKQGL